MQHYMTAHQHEEPNGDIVTFAMAKLMVKDRSAEEHLPEAERRLTAHWRMAKDGSRKRLEYK